MGAHQVSTAEHFKLGLYMGAHQVSTTEHFKLGLYGCTSGQYNWAFQTRPEWVHIRSVQAFQRVPSHLCTPCILCKQSIIIPQIIVLIFRLHAHLSAYVLFEYQGSSCVLKSLIFDFVFLRPRKRLKFAKIYLWGLKRSDFFQDKVIVSRFGDCLHACTRVLLFTFLVLGRNYSCTIEQ